MVKASFKIFDREQRVHQLEKTEENQLFRVHQMVSINMVTVIAATDQIIEHESFK